MYLFMRVLNYTYNLGVYMYKSYRNLKVYNSYIYMYVYVHIYIYSCFLACLFVCAVHFSCRLITRPGPVFAFLGFG